MDTTAIGTFKPDLDSRADFWHTLGIEGQGMSRNSAIHAGFGSVVYHQLVQKARLTQSEFQAVTLIPVSTIKRRLKNSERFTVQESDAMYRLALLIKLATELLGTEARALDWIREPVYGLSGKRPLDMVAMSADFKVVRDLMGRIEHGVFT